VHVLGYVEGALWRLVVFPSTRAGGDEVPQLQRQVMGGGWEIAAQDDVLAHLVLRAYHRGRRQEDRTLHHGLVIPGSPED
jgi:hypothetical protein